MNLRKVCLLAVFVLLLPGAAGAGEPVYTCTRIELPFRNIADFFLEGLQNISDDLSLSSERFREIPDRLRENRHFQKWAERFREARDTLLPEDSRLRLTFRYLAPKVYKDDEGLHIAFAVDFAALRKNGKEDAPRDDSAASGAELANEDFVLHILLKAEAGEDWAATLKPSVYLRWGEQARSFELPEGILLDAIRKCTRRTETLLNGQLDLAELKHRIPFRSETGSDDVKPDSLRHRTVEPWIRKLWDSMLTGYPEVCRIEYETQDAHGRTITASGVLVFPFPLPADLSHIPVLSIQHPTLVERRYSPSEFLRGLREPVSSQFFAPLALMAAARGYLVVGSDYPGLGVSTATHPFCHASLASSVVDAIRVAQSVLNERLRPRGEVWKGNLYLVGYSEGGYASMVAARRLQEGATGAPTPSGVACMSGPYSLSEAMRSEMAAPVENYATPYLLPLLLAGYDSIYPGSGFAFGEAIRRDVPGFADYPAELCSLVDGVRTEDEINTVIRRSPDYAARGPMSLMTPDFLNGLRDPGSAIVRILAENDAHRGWVPKISMKLTHNTKDRTVPVANTTIAFAAFEAAGASCVETEFFDDCVTVTGNVHVDAAAPSFMKGMLWLNALKEEESF